MGCASPGGGGAARQRELEGAARRWEVQEAVHRQEAGGCASPRGAGVARLRDVRGGRGKSPAHSSRDPVGFMRASASRGVVVVASVRWMVAAKKTWGWR